MSDTEKTEAQQLAELRQAHSDLQDRYNVLASEHKTLQLERNTMVSRFEAALTAAEVSQ